ncbi:hypothetical protein, partial [Klebsiella pneumoniae]|uniref:hypothetical protein n=1 Tax=Klebsiella pneumoniae TaxID=573 RepID=UPI00210DA771
TAQLAALSPIHTIAPHLSQHACEQLMGVEHERQQDSFPEDKPMESLLDILKLGFRGYRHLAEFSPPSLTRLVYTNRHTSITSSVSLDAIGKQFKAF